VVVLINGVRPPVIGLRRTIADKFEVEVGCALRALACGQAAEVVLAIRAEHIVIGEILAKPRGRASGGTGERVSGEFGLARGCGHEGRVQRGDRTCRLVVSYDVREPTPPL
jgi:hypothetical protein